MPSAWSSDVCSRSEEHTSELQSHDNLVCRLLLEKTKPTFREIFCAPPPTAPPLGESNRRHSTTAIRGVESGAYPFPGWNTCTGAKAGTGTGEWIGRLVPSRPAPRTT